MRLSVECTAWFRGSRSAPNSPVKVPVPVPARARTRTRTRARARARARLSILQKFLREIDQLGAVLRQRLAKIAELGSIPGNEASERFG
jgi:hypothetical protein